MCYCLHTTAEQQASKLGISDPFRDLCAGGQDTGMAGEQCDCCHQIGCHMMLDSGSHLQLAMEAMQIVLCMGVWPHKQA